MASSSSNQPPITPEKQIIGLHSDMDPNSPVLDDIECTPDTKSKMRSLKRKASQLSEQDTPTTTAPWLNFRFAVVKNELELRQSQLQALMESKADIMTDGTPKSEWLAQVKKDEKGLQAELNVLLANRKIIEGDMNDTVTVGSPGELANAYIQELRASLAAASSDKKGYPGQKQPRLDRRAFAAKVMDYLSCLMEVRTETSKDNMKWCNIMGYWLGPSSVKCAHIIPFSWDTKELAYLFGSDEPPLTSPRNGLSMQAKLEEAFDNCRIVIVPDGTVESVPTKWRVRVLNPAIMNNTFFTDMAATTDHKDWKFKDIDDRPLSFNNSNRPARRYLYLRYTLAWLHAEDKNWPGFKEKVPPGTVWASPNKPDGYLRKSFLLELGKRTGDKLPQDLISAGVFEDPKSSSPVADEVSATRVTEYAQGHLEGKRDPKGDDDEEDDDDDEDDEEEEE
ncbi:MAG: hypothetical protein Q9226_007938 [Calogaya cf. arnoldii]